MPAVSNPEIKILEGVLNYVRKTDRDKEWEIMNNECTNLSLRASPGFLAAYIVEKLFTYAACVFDLHKFILLYIC